MITRTFSKHFLRHPLTTILTVIGHKPGRPHLFKPLQREMLTRSFLVLLVLILNHIVVYTCTCSSISNKRMLGVTTALQSMTIPERAVQRFSVATPPMMRLSLTQNMHKLQQKARSSMPTVLRNRKHLAPNTGVQCLKVAELKEMCITPLLVMVNQKSGGGEGVKLLHSLRSVLHEAQVCDVQAESSQSFLSRFMACSDNMKLLVCGGDGTVSKVMKELYDLNMSHVPIGVVPIGTGNDLVNSLTSAYFQSDTPRLTAEVMCEDPARALASFVDPKIGDVDTWSIERSPSEEKPLTQVTPDVSFPERAGSDPHRSKYTYWLKKSLVRRREYSDKTMVNYFSLGVDSHVSLDFDALRQSKPRLFVSRLVNKLWYGLLGVKVFFQQPNLDLSESVSIACDGKKVDVPRGTKGIVLLNVDSYAGGSKIWPEPDGEPVSEGRRTWKKTACSDGILEVVALEGILHLGAIKGGLARATRLAQGRCVQIESKKPLPMQVDGEPFVQSPCKMKLSRRGSTHFMIPVDHYGS